MGNRFRRRLATLALGATFAIVGGCKRAVPSQEEAIRAGITQHLASFNTLNISAMNLEINNVSIQGKQAQVQVTFRPKSGAPAGAEMQVAYQMEKRDSGWVVVKTEGAGGSIEHPGSANAHPQAGQANVHGSMPNFRELIPSTTPATGGALPPGHPPIPQAQTKTADPNAKPD